MTKLTDAERSSLMMAALTDARLAPSERARARALLAELPDARRVSVQGLLAGPFLTTAGLEAVRGILPAPEPSHLRHALEDLLRRLRARGHACRDVEIGEEDGVWRVSFDGEGREQFSRRSASSALAQQARADLLRSALELGLTSGEEGDAFLTFQPPDVEYSDEGEDLVPEDPDAEEVVLVPNRLWANHPDELPLDRLARVYDRQEAESAPVLERVRRALAHLAPRPLRTSGEMRTILESAEEERAAC